MNAQRISSIVRQAGAVLVSIYGFLTATSVAPHLPAAVTTVLVAFGPTILLLEHFLGDPSTGTSTVTTPVAQKQTAPVATNLMVTTTPANSATPAVVLQPTPPATVIPPDVHVPNPAPPSPA